MTQEIARLNNQITDWNVQQLDGVPDDAHHDEANTDGSNDFQVFFKLVLHFGKVGIRMIIPF